MIAYFKIKMLKTRLQTDTGQMTNDKAQMSSKFQNPNTKGGFAILASKNLFGRGKVAFGALNMKRGFTLIESLIAISILTIAVTASMSLTVNSLATVKLSKNQLIASGLAQETLELIRNQRDNNFLDRISGGNDDWLEGISKNGGTFRQPCRDGRAGTDGCVIKIRPEANAAQHFINILHTTGLDANKADILYKGRPNATLEEVDKVYRHRTSDNDDRHKTQFSRFVTVEEFEADGSVVSGSGQEGAMARVTVWIEWEERGEPQDIQVDAYLFSWLPI